MLLSVKFENNEIKFSGTFVPLTEQLSALCSLREDLVNGDDYSDHLRKMGVSQKLFEKKKMFYAPVISAGGRPFFQLKIDVNPSLLIL